MTHAFPDKDAFADNPTLTAGVGGAAITRAREAVVVVGAEATMRTALQGTQGDVRLSSLHGRLAAAADRLNLPRYAHTPPCSPRKPALTEKWHANLLVQAVEEKLSLLAHGCRQFKPEVQLVSLFLHFCAPLSKL